MRKIWIWCSPGSGSSLLSATLSKCGMQLGDEENFYKTNGNWENSLINLLHGQMQNGNTNPITHPPWLVSMYNQLPDGEPEGRYRFVLRRYMEVAERKGWSCFGLKTTTGLAPNQIFYLMKIIEEEWGNDVIYLSTVRHPFGAYERLRKLKSEETKSIYSNWLSHLLQKLVLFHRGGFLVRYPEDWLEGNNIQALVEALGLSWNEDAKNHFERKKSTIINQESSDSFFAVHKDLQTAYNIVAGLCYHG